MKLLSNEELNKRLSKMGYDNPGYFFDVKDHIEILTKENRVLRDGVEAMAKQLTPEEHENEDGEELDPYSGLEAYELMVLDARKIIYRVDEIRGGK